nr:MAG TPA: hypothetical protein [Bacteriophage sp.]
MLQSNIQILLYLDNSYDFHCDISYEDCNVMSTH